MASGDCYQVNLKTRFKTDMYLLNTFYLRQVDGASQAALAATQALFANVVPFIKPVMSPDIQFVEISAVNLFDKADVYVLPFAANTKGTGSGSPMPPFVAVSLKFPRLRADMRNGSKRFAGISEVNVTDGTIVSTEITKFNAIGDALAAQLVGTLPSLSHFKNCIVKRIRTALVGGGWEYRLPAAQSQFQYYDTTSYVVNTLVTSQNTRKFGRGT